MRCWHCPKCKTRFAIRPTTEDESAFAQRVRAHTRGALCRTRALQHMLSSRGLRTFPDPDVKPDAMITMGVLRDAGLVQRHRTRVTARIVQGRVVGHRTLAEDWAPEWAMRYERYLAGTDHWHLRARTLRKVAESATEIERAEAIMALGKVRL